MRIKLDSNETTLSLDGTNDGTTLIWNADNLGDDDHQLLVHINSLPQNGSVVVDYFEYVVPLLHFVTRIVLQQVSAFRFENSSGKGFDLLWAGPNATNVPKEAITADNSSPDIAFSNLSLWRPSNSLEYFGSSISYTLHPGASLSFKFYGVAIWYDCVSYT